MGWMHEMGGRIGRAVAGLSLRARLVALVLVAALPGLLLAEQEAQQTRQHALDLLQERALRLARKSALEQEAAFAATRQLLSTLAAVPAIRNGEACGPMLAAALTNPGYEWIAVVDGAGRVLCGAGDGAGNA